MWPLEHREHVPHQTKVSVKKVPMTTHVHMQASGIKCFVCQFTLDMVMHSGLGQQVTHAGMCQGATVGGV